MSGAGGDVTTIGVAVETGASATASTTSPISSFAFSAGPPGAMPATATWFLISVA